MDIEGFVSLTTLEGCRYCCEGGSGEGKSCWGKKSSTTTTSVTRRRSVTGEGNFGDCRTLECLHCGNKKRYYRPSIYCLHGVMKR